MDVNVLRLTARNGLDNGNFTLLDLSLGFWANGGHAEAWDLDAFIYGLTTLSGRTYSYWLGPWRNFTMSEKPVIPPRALEPFSQAFCWFSAVSGS